MDPLHAFHAFLGFSESFREPTARICCRCPGKADVEQICEIRGYGMTHTFCPTHHAEELAIALGEPQLL
jgi:hypothetical protein